MLKCSFPMTASVQESLENHFKQHPIPIKPSAEFISKIAVSASVFRKLEPRRGKNPALRSQLSVCILLSGLFGNTGNRTAPVHIDAFVCTLTFLIRTSCLSFLFFVFFFTFKKNRRHRVREVRALDL